MKFGPGRHLRLVLRPRQLGRQRLGEYDQLTWWGVRQQKLGQGKVKQIDKEMETKPQSDSL